LLVTFSLSIAQVPSTAKFSATSPTTLPTKAMDNSTDNNSTTKARSNSSDDNTTTLFPITTPSDKDPDQCVFSCVDKIIELASSLNVSALMQKPAKALDILCPVVDQMTKCVAKCSKSKLKDIMEKFNPYTKFVCVDRRADFTQHLPCMVETFREPKVILNCINSKCNYSTKFSAMPLNLTAFESDIFSISKASEILGNSTSLTDYCDSLECSTNCAAAIIAENCTRKASNLFKENAKQQMIVTTDVLELVGFSKNTLPKACQRIASFSSGSGGLAQISTSLLLAMIMICALKDRLF